MFIDRNLLIVLLKVPSMWLLISSVLKVTKTWYWGTSQCMLPVRCLSLLQGFLLLRRGMLLVLCSVTLHRMRYLILSQELGDSNLSTWSCVYLVKFAMSCNNFIIFLSLLKHWTLMWELCVRLSCCGFFFLCHVFITHLFQGYQSSYSSVHILSTMVHRSF